VPVSAKGWSISLNEIRRPVVKHPQEKSGLLEPIAVACLTFEASWPLTQAETRGKKNGSSSIFGQKFD
jgi:hypothetical protein